LPFQDRPDSFVYDGVKFIEGGAIEWAIDTKHDDSAGEFQIEIPSLAQALAAVDGIGSLAEAKPVLKKMIRAIYALGRRAGIDSS